MSDATRSSVRPARILEVGRRIRDLREAAGMSQAALGEALGRTQTAVSYWESGRRLPGLEELGEIAEALDRDVAELLPPPSTRVAVPALLRAAVDQLDEDSLGSIDRFLEMAERLADREPAATVSEESPIRAAHQALSKARLADAPIDVHAVAEAFGVQVLESSFSNALSGFVVVLANGPVIGVNGTHPETRRRFTIAHELGHYLLRHHDKIYVDVDFDEAELTGRRWQLERDANEFAANLLMPAALVRVRHTKTPSVERLAPLFEVSKLAMRYRLVNLGLR